MIIVTCLPLTDPVVLQVVFLPVCRLHRELLRRDPPGRLHSALEEGQGRVGRVGKA